MDVDFINDRAWLSPNEVPIASLLGCTRASQKWVKNTAGSLVSFANNALPYTDLGVLPEAASTNLFLQSQAMNTTNWTGGSNIVATDNATAAPDGATTAELFTDANTTTTVQVYIGRTLTVPSSGTYDISIFVKAGTITRLRISTVSFDASGNGDSYFNLATGALGTISANHANARITAYANGWYRCSLSFTTTTDLAGSVRFGMATSDTLSISSNGTQTFNLWQAQCEAGTRPSSIIPTTTTTVTRAADVVTFSDLTWFNGTADSHYAEWNARNVDGAVVWAWDATNNKLLDETIGMSPRLSGAVVANTVAADGIVKVAGRMKLDDFALCLAGGTVATDTSETAPGALTASRLGCDLAGANYLGNFICRIASFGSAIDDGGLQLLSAPFEGYWDSTSVFFDDQTIFFDQEGI